MLGKKAMVAIFLIMALSTSTFSAESANNAYQVASPFPNQTAILQISEKSQKTDVNGNISVNKINHDIDIITNTDKKKVASATLSYDLHFSSKDNKTQIQNISLKIIEEAEPGTIKSKVSKVVGDSIELAGFDCNIYNESESNPINLKFTVISDKDGNTSISYPENMITVDKEADAQYQYDRGFRILSQTEDSVSRVKEADSKYPLKLLKVGVFQEADNSDLLYRVKQYETQSVQLDAKDNKNNRVSDLNTKEIKYEIEFKTNEEENIGTYQISGFIKYSKNKDYAFTNVSGSLSTGYNDWTAISENEEVGIYTNFNLLGIETNLLDDGVQKYKINIVILGDSEGVVQIKPIVASR